MKHIKKYSVQFKWDILLLTALNMLNFKTQVSRQIRLLSVFVFTFPRTFHGCYLRFKEYMLSMSWGGPINWDMRHRQWYKSSSKNISPTLAALSTYVRSTSGVSRPQKQRLNTRDVLVASDDCEIKKSTLAVNTLRQECFPVECVPTAAVAATRCHYRGLGRPPGGRPPLQRQTPPCGQTLLKTLPSLAVGKYVTLLIFKICR